eukprot:TRINITY_DN31654_c0_g1_i1.p1 TRINITY_DN31654_c0_g1~~TRINITY_DN31654_c0_g1_i1.p1  ORF type:complete len:296 (-),score=28.54 TRINITY_DN31654_c0_g1_i1:162-1049(-)
MIGFPVSILMEQKTVFPVVRQGLTLAWSGFCASSRNPHVRRTFRRCLTTLIPLVAAMYLSGLLLLLPVRILAFAASYVFPSVYDLLPGPVALLQHVCCFIPSIALLFFRQLGRRDWTEGVFFALLTDRDAKLSAFLQAQQPLPFGYRKFLLRFIKNVSIASAVYVLSLVPYIGDLVVIAAQFFLTSRIMGSRRALVFALFCGLAPPVKPYATLLLSVWISAFSLGREILDPYFCRQVDQGVIKKILKHNEVLVMSFCLPFSLALTVPFVGPLLWVFTQASAAVLLTALVNDHDLY